ncbi:MAG: hypothetical protein ACK55X_03465 [Synechococcaceae cyanobacterium]|jgi:hypothetical protein
MTGSSPPLQKFPIGCLKERIVAKYGERIGDDAVDAFRYDELGGMAAFIASAINPAGDPLTIYAELVRWSADCIEREGLAVQQSSLDIEDAL